MEPPIGPLVRRSNTFPARQQQLVGLPAEFMEKWNMVPDDMEYDSKLGRFKYRGSESSADVVSTSNDLSDQMRKTAEAIAEYQRYGKLKFKARWEVDANGLWNWEKVMKDMNAAVETYEGLARVDKKDFSLQNCCNLIRKCFRKFSSNAQSFKDWLAVIPDGDYGAILCGSLEMIFTAAARLGKVRHDLLEALSEMPETIALAHSYGDIYKNSVQMRHAIHRFEVSTLMALEYILLWLTEKPISKVIEMMRKQSGYGKNLFATFGTFKKSVEKLNDMAKLSLHQISKESFSHIHKGRLEQAQHTIALANIDSKVQKVESQYEELDNQLERQGEAVQRVKLQTEKIIANQEMAQDMVNSILEQLKCNPRLQEVTSGLQQQRRAALLVNRDYDDLSDEDFAFSHVKTLPAVHRAALQRHIGNMFLNQSRCDIEAAISCAYLMPFEEQDRQFCIAESSIMGDFFAAASPSAALIQGNSPHDDDIASTSVYAAMLVFALQEIHIPVIHFSCGLHKDPYVQDPFLGPCGMMLGLLQQLLETYPLNYLTFLEQTTLYHQFSTVESIGCLMQALISNEPHTSTTFCVVDGISFFENSTCEAQTHKAIAHLLQVALESEGRFKLLFTSPTRSMYVPQHLLSWPGSAHVLNVTPDIVNGRRQGGRPAVLKHAMTDSLIQTRQPPPWDNVY